MKNAKGPKETDLICMNLAVQQARLCKGKTTDPYVGAVALVNGGGRTLAFRGELKAGEHAEYTLLEGKLHAETLAGSTVFTTLEPCTARGPNKVPCVHRLIERKVARVVIGMLDPDQRITGRGILELRRAGIAVDLFPPHLASQLEELNRGFTRSRLAACDTSDLRSTPFYSWDSVPALQFSLLLRNASTLWVLARTAVNMLSRHNDDISRFLQRGGALHIMVSDPDSPHCRVMYGPHTSLYQANVAVAKTHLASLAAKAPDRVRVKFLPKPPNYGAVLIQGKDLVEGVDSLIQLLMYPEYSSTGSGRPVLVVFPSDEYWFNVFEQDIMNVWAES